MEGTYLNIIKTIFDKPTANIILNDEKLKTFPLKSGTDKGAYSHHYYSHSFGSISHSNQRRKGNKSNQIGKEEVKLSLFADDMIVFYIEKSKGTIRKLLELINEYHNIARYKINTQKSLAFLYTKNEKTER